jgi:hypothetical protein
MKQTYANYHKAYYDTPNGRASKRRAQNRYRQKLAELYGMSQTKALKKHKEMLRNDPEAL